METLSKPQNQGEQLPPDESDPIKVIQEYYNLGVTEDERQTFENWFNSHSSSFDLPMRLERIEQSLEHLPKSPNPDGNGVEVYFEITHSLKDVHDVLDRWREGNPVFEIAVHRYNENIFSIEVGNRMGGTAPREGAHYVGHYHPQLSYENPDLLPGVFVAGIMPSSGDIKGFLQCPGAIRDGTRIVSGNGYAEIRFIDQSVSLGLNEYTRKLDTFRSKYLDLFRGVNRIGMTEDIVSLLKEFNLHADFHMDSVKADSKEDE